MQSGTERGDGTFFFFFLVFWRKHFGQVGDAPLTEFFEFQLITRCKRERREIYVPHFVCRDASRDLGFRCTEQLRNISDREFRAAEMRRRVSERERTSVVTSSYLISECRAGPKFRKLRGPYSCQLADISRPGFSFFFFFIDSVQKIKIKRGLCISWYYLNLYPFELYPREAIFYLYLMNVRKLYRVSRVPSGEK